MTDNDERIKKILMLKNYEKPRDGYFEDFLEEFRSRQRSELLHRSSTGIFIERGATWFREVGPVKWVAGAGVAYAALMAGILLRPTGGGNGVDPTLAPASHQPVAPERDRDPVAPPVTDDVLHPGQDF